MKCLNSSRFSFPSSLPGAVSVSEALAPRATSRASLDAGGAKPKLCCPKDNWHGYVEPQPETEEAIKFDEISN